MNNRVRTVLLAFLLVLLGAPARAQDDDSTDVGPEVEGRRERKRATGRGDMVRDEEIPEGSWRRWWEWNRAASLSPRSRATEPATKDDLADVVRPALAGALARADEKEPVRAAALLALGRAGTHEYIGRLADASANDLVNDDGAPIKLDDAGTGRALLALGLLPDLDDIGREGARDALFDVLRDGDRSVRDRAWAALALGLRGDPKTVKPLAELVHGGGLREAAAGGALMALGLSGDPYVRELLEGVLLQGRLAGRSATATERAGAGWALGRLGHARSLAPVVAAIPAKARQSVKASILAAAGALARDAEPAEKEKAVDALRKFLRKPDDPVNAGLACIALGRIGNEEALRVLLPLAERGKAELRPYAALGIGLAAGRGALEEGWRDRAVNALARLTRRFKDSESRAAVLLARGLARDPTAVPELIPLAADEGDPLVRARACEALGLIGDASEAVTGALLTALRDRGAPAVRDSAARGLALLHEKVVTRLLRHEAETAAGAAQVAAIEALGHHGDRSALPRLAEMLGDARRSPEVRAAAAEALGRIANPAPALEDLGKDFNYRSSVAELNELLTLL